MYGSVEIDQEAVASFAQKPKARWISIAVGSALLGMCVIIAVLGSSSEPTSAEVGAQPGISQPIDELVRKHGISSHEEHRICESWKNTHVFVQRPRTRCTATGLERVKKAFQDENCKTALSSDIAATEVGSKIKKLADESAFVFFRGAASFFAFDMACTLAQFSHGKRGGIPHVTSNGDCHPENFGVMEMANGHLTWGVNDFDNAFAAPFDWDVRRGATGFQIACEVAGSKDCNTYASEFVKSYMNTMGSCEFVNDDRFLEGSKELDKHPVIRKCVDDIRAARDGPNKRREWLEKKVDLKRGEFKKAANLIPVDKSRFPEFQQAIENYLYHGVSALVDFPARRNFYRILDIVEKKGSGTGSVGLQRYWMLMHGGEGEDGRLILEMKQESDSVLERYSLNSDVTQVQEATRVVQGAKSGFPFADLFYGWVMYKEQPFLIRERNMFKADVDISTLDSKQYLDYASASGRALGLFHLKVTCQDKTCGLRDQSAVDVELCHNINHYLKENKKLESEIVEWANDEAKRQIAAHAVLQDAFKASKELQEDPVSFLN